jgi:hypothetical protein
LLASIARLRFADKGIIKLWTNEPKASIIERQGVGYLVVSPLGSTSFSRQVAMYLAKFVGGWSTTQIGKFYNGRDHSTVCYALRRIETLREADSNVDGVLTALAQEVRTLQPVRTERKIRLTTTPRIQDKNPLISEELLDRLAERIADRVLSRIGGGLGHLADSDFGNRLSG